MKLRVFILILFFSITLLILPPQINAESPYVLPYPSSMPGSVWYKLDLLKEMIMQYWYYGDFGQFEYNLAQSDKYLVEAKTLFEYKQYLLGYNALLKSDQYFKMIEPSLISAEKHNKKITEKRDILNSAAEKHIEILQKLKIDVPQKFNWTPEKAKPTYLYLGKAINNAINIRSTI